MTTPDPLTLLRHALTANKAPTLHAAPDPSSAALPTDSLASATHLYFPTPAITLSLDTPTRFQRKTPEPLTFSLREIFFAWLLQGESTAEYIARCQALGIHNLTFLEKADLSTWLEGGDSSDYIGSARNLLILLFGD
jgi:parafibromin